MRSWVRLARSRKSSLPAESCSSWLSRRLFAATTSAEPGSATASEAVLSSVASSPPGSPPTEAAAMPATLITQAEGTATVSSAERLAGVRRRARPRGAEARPAERFTGCGAGKASPPPCSGASSGATSNAGSGTVSGARAANSAVEDGSAPGSSAAWSGSAGPSDGVASADTCSYAESDVCSDPYALSPGVAPEFQAVAS